MAMASFLYILLQTDLNMNIKPILPIAGIWLSSLGHAQQKTMLTIEQAIGIALHESYTVQSNDEARNGCDTNTCIIRRSSSPGWI
jgi:hypothetical protein